MAILDLSAFAPLVQMCRFGNRVSDCGSALTIPPATSSPVSRKANKWVHRMPIDLRLNGRAARTVAQRMATVITAAVGALAILPPAQAAPVTVNFSGTVDFIQEYEYGTAQPLPAGSVPILSFFNGATRITGRYTYDPSMAVDLDPNPSSGQYAMPGSFSMALPDIGMEFAGSGTLGISVYTAGEFHVNANANLPFVGDAGGAMPFSLFFDFYGPRKNDSLPTGPVVWNYGNAHFDFANVSPFRDIFIGVIPTPVPVPASYAMMLAGLGLLGFGRRRRQTSHHEATSSASAV